MNPYYDPRIGKLFRMTGFHVKLRGGDFIFSADSQTILQVSGYKQAMIFAKGVMAGRRCPPFEFKSEYMQQPSTEKETP